MNQKKSDGKKRPSASFVTGAIALAFLITGYQTALFVHRAAALKVVSDMTSPDTVFVYADGEAFAGGKSGSNAPQNYRYEKRPGKHPEAAEKLAAAYTPRTYESFRFNPNTVSVNDLCRLGFSLKQANSIDNYRKKGGRFKRKQDFAKSFVVADSVYRRLEKYIDIPLLDLNAADSAAFDELPGIGGYFAAKMVEFRGRLGGYSCPEQLLDIYHFDAEKLAKIRDLVEVKTRPEPFRLWSLPADSLKCHPYIKTWQTAKSIVLYRENNPRSELTVDGLVRAGILDKDTGAKLSRCLIESP